MTLQEASGPVVLSVRYTPPDAAECDSVHIELHAEPGSRVRVQLAQQRNADTADRTGPVTAGPESETKLFLLREACEMGIIPLSYDAARHRKSRGRKQGRPFPAGIVREGGTYFTARELRDWYEAEKNFTAPPPSAARPVA
ncbi:hypothetical protein [Streptomyces sp. NBC_01276]|uniref:hypothetical protein n=1 Tax=Streptomyces sp. NBC_01276 TaxID=2903808 RepID=UPI002F90E9C5